MKPVKEIMIEDLTKNNVNGIEVQFPDERDYYKEKYFQWEESKITAIYGSQKVSGGILRSWKHEVVFDELEWHIDAEHFYFISGTAIMVFADIKDENVDESTIKVVRIHPGTQICIPKGKGHFVPVAENSKEIEIVVVAPKMDAPRIKLSFTIKGVPKEDNK